MLASQLSLEALDVSLNYLTKISGSTLHSILKAMPRLSYLNLQMNELGDEGVIALAPALHSCASLQTLILSDNKITDKGASALKEALLENAHLSFLDLSGNSISEPLLAEITKLVEAGSRKQDSIAREFCAIVTGSTSLVDHLPMIVYDYLQPWDLCKEQKRALAFPVSVQPKPTPKKLDIIMVMGAFQAFVRSSNGRAGLIMHAGDLLSRPQKNDLLAHLNLFFSRKNVGSAVRASLDEVSGDIELSHLSEAVLKPFLV